MRENDIKKMKEFQAMLKEIEYIKYTLNSLIYWDKITNMPKGGIYYRSDVISYFGGELYKKFSSARLYKYVEYFEKNYKTDKKISAMMRKIKRNYMYVNQIPKKVYQDYITHISLSEAAWEEAKIKDKFEIFAPYLEKIVEYFKKFAEYWGYEKDPYDALMGYYEDGITTGTMDKLIEELKVSIIEILEQVKSKKLKISKMKLDGEYSIEKQRYLSEELLKIIGFDFEYGRLDISEHPTTLASSPKDVRLITTFNIKDIVKGIYNTLHEGGKALYEQDIDENLLGTLLAEVSTFSLEEAEARIYGSIIGKDRNFCKILLEKIKGIFSEYEKISVDEFYQEVNRVEPSLIRIDADELTYLLHIIIRYEIERDLINNKIEVKNLSKIWREKYREYLKILPETDRDGVLQDIHWAAGYFGYFPSYLLSIIYSGQIAGIMDRELGGITERISIDNLKLIHQWLKENIHRHGSVYTPEELINNISGEKIDSSYYIDYLRKKYNKLYKI